MYDFNKFVNLLVSQTTQILDIKTNSHNIILKQQ